jgi:hypothetical protein
LVKRQNIIARPVTVFGRNPSNLSRQVRTVRSSELPPLKFNNEFFPCLAKSAVAVVSFHRIEFPDKAPQGAWNHITGCRESRRRDKDVGS